MSSIAGWAAPPLYSIYSAAKFGIRGFSEALRRETAPMCVHVSAIYPGSSPTEFQKHVGENRAKKRFSTPEWLRVTPEEAENWPHKNVIVRALGMKESVQVDILTEIPRVGDTFMAPWCHVLALAHRSADPA